MRDSGPKRSAVTDPREEHRASEALERSLRLVSVALEILIKIMELTAKWRWASSALEWLIDALAGS